MDTRDKGRRRPPFPPLNRQCDLLKGQCRGPFRVSGAVLTLFAPVSALLRAFVALLGRWWHPCTPPTLETRCRPPVGRCFGSEGRGRRGQCRGSIFVLDKAVISPPPTPSRNAGRGMRFHGGFDGFGSLFCYVQLPSFFAQCNQICYQQSKNCGSCRSIQVSKELSIPLLTDILEVL